MDALVNIADVCTEIFAGGDAPKGKISKVKTDEYSVPIFSNGVPVCWLHSTLTEDGCLPMPIRVCRSASSCLFLRRAE